MPDSPGKESLQSANGAHLVVGVGPMKGCVVQPPPGEVLVLGSDENCGFHVPDPSIAGQHLRLERTGDGALFADDLSSGRTRLNGVTLRGRVMLRTGDEVLVGQLPLRVQGAAGGFSSATPGPAQPAELVPGTLVADRYRIVKKLAEGGMGAVYRAEHVELGRTFALKVMLPELTGAADFIERFRREAVASSKIGHPNIVDITDFGRTTDGYFFFAMEFLEGETLADLLETEGPQSVKRVQHIIAQACRGLAAAHAQGIVHRDLKPENIMVVQRPGFPDLVKILDFGIAKVTQGVVMSNGTTGVGVVVGTPQYMSPEQASGLSLDLRSDIYSLGLITYELLTGRRTFDAPTPSLLLAKHVSEPPPPMTQGPREPIPQAMKALVFKMLAKPVRMRPQTMNEVIDAMGLSDGPSAAPKQSAIPTQMRVPPAVVPASTSAPTRAIAKAQPAPTGTSKLWAAIPLGAALIGLVWLFVHEPKVPPPDPVPTVQTPKPVELSTTNTRVDDTATHPVAVPSTTPPVDARPHPVGTQPPRGPTGTRPPPVEKTPPADKTPKPAPTKPKLKEVYDDEDALKVPP